MREFDLLQHVFEANDQLDQSVRIPPGDDMGMIDWNGDSVLAAVDQVVDGRHLHLESTPIALVGRKCMTRSLSDIAAMAARPLCSLAAVCLPSGMSKATADALFDAMRATAVQYGCPLIGGDIAIHQSSSHPFMASVTVLATPLAGDLPPRCRSMARVDDEVYVSGVIGGSYRPDGLGHHLTFEPRIKIAIELYHTLGSHLHAMIDLSDGLGRDAGHLAKMSHVAIEIDADALPTRDGVEWPDAVRCGEDYELLFTASCGVPESIVDVPITRVGRVVARDDAGSVSVDTGAGQRMISDQGWEHSS